MKSYIGITGKYLRGQKKRSVLTVIGVILSVALVTGIGSIFTSVFDADMRYTIKENGDFYAQVDNVQADKLSQLTQNVQTLNAGTGVFEGFAAYSKNDMTNAGEGDTPYKYLSIQSLDASAQKMLPYEIEAGRMPTAPGEIAVDNWTLKYLNAKLGGNVTLDIGTRSMPDGTAFTDTKSSDPHEIFTKRTSAKYMIVGTIKPPYVMGLNFAKAVTWLDSAHLPAAETVSCYIKLKSPIGAQKTIQAMADAAGVVSKDGKSPITYNDHVLRMYAQGMNETFNSSFMGIIGVITALVVVATIAVIYNAFNISVVERISQFGLLRCVGATPSQIRSIVFREALLLGCIGIPIGILCGTLAMGVVFSIITSFAGDMLRGGLRLVVSPIIIASSAVIGAFTVYLSAFLPARRAARVSPMEAVRSTGAFKKEKFRKSDRHRLMQKLLGSEGWLAWKNLGRNRKRFYITTFSMVISIVLFIVFSSLVNMAFNSGAVDTQDMPNYVIYTTSARNKVDIPKNFVDSVQAERTVDYSLEYSTTDMEVLLPATKLDKRAEELIKASGLAEFSADSVSLMNSQILCYSDESIELLKQKMGLTNLDTQAFLNGDGVILINGGAMPDKIAKKMVMTDVTTVNAGETLSVNNKDFSTDPATDHISDLKVLAVAESGMPGYSRKDYGGVYLIASEKLFSRLAPDVPFPMSMMIMMKQNTDHASVKKLVDSFMEQNPLYNLTDLDTAANNNKQTILVISIFLYGFVAVISLIGCLNIINTISTNIIVRTRELSVLRAIGMNDGGVRKMVAWESILHAAAAALVGSVFGVALSYLVYHSMIAVREFPWQFPGAQILIAIGAAALVAIVSGFIPLRRINSGIIMEGIRGEE